MPNQSRKPNRQGLGLLESVSAAALVLCSATPVLAQSTEAAAEDNDDIIVVTATRRAESVQDVSNSVAAFGGEQIDQLGASNLADLAAAVPGAEIFDDRGAGQPTWVIRGVGLADFNPNNTPTAAIYYDENYLVSNVLGGIGLFDLERVEILKGPQGGLYGRNTTGGAVRVISAKPELDSLAGFAKGSFGSWNAVGVEGALNVPLVADKIGLRLAASLAQGGGWQDSLTTPQDDNYGDRDFLAVRGQLRFALSPDVEALFKIDYGRDKSETTLGRSTGAYDEFGNFCAAIAAGRRDNANCLGLHNLLGSPLLPSLQDAAGRAVLSNPINQLDNDWLGVNIQFDADLGFAELKSISAYLKYDYRQTIDYDATPLILGHSARQSEIEQWLQEVRLVSSGDGPVSWILGGLYSTDAIADTGPFSFNDNFFVQSAIASLFPVGFPLPIGVLPSYTQKTKSWALYGELGYKLSESVDVSGSLRYTDERKRQVDYGTTIIFDGFDVPILTGLNQKTRLGSRVSGHFGIDWKPVDDVLVYAKYSRGFKSGGFFGGISSDPEELVPYGAETVNAYEIGVKSELVDGLTLNGAFFYYDYRDAQGFILVTSSVTGDVVTRLGTLGDARHIGAELEFSWKPDAIKGFSLQGSASYLDAKITKSDFQTFTQEGNLVPLEGLTRAYSPKFSFFVMARQEVLLSDSILGAAQVSYSYRDDLSPRSSFGSTISYGLSRNDGYGLLNARVSIGRENGGWELALSGENLTKKAYLASATFDDLGSYLDIPGPPRRFRVEASFEF